MADWGRVKSIFAELQELPEAERPAALELRCGADAALRRAVLELLAAEDQAGAFLRTPAEAAGGGSPDEPLLGVALGPYLPLEVIGEGGFAVVFRARQDAPVQRDVAIKVIKPGMDSRSVLARFELERRTLARLEHPHIARALDAGTTPRGRPFFVMELVRGEPLTRYCDTHQLSIPARVELLVRVCRAVHHAHQKGVIHRDLKPSNVLVTTVDGQPTPKVIDFGIAKALDDSDPHCTRTRQPVGTPSYMSPEQANTDGAAVDTRTDIYALGVILHEVLAGVLPWRAEGAALDRLGPPPRPSSRVRATRGGSDSRGSAGSGTRAMRASPTNATVDVAQIALHRGTTPAALRDALRDDLDWIILRCLAPEPSERYDSAAELARDLELHLQQRPVSAGPPHWSYRLSKFARRNRAAFAGGAVALLALIVGLLLALGGLLTALRASADEQRARVEAQRAADRAAAVNQFLQDLFSAADPRLSGDDRSVRAVLLEGASRIDEGALADQPEIEADARLQIGRALRELGQLAAASPQLERALRMRRTLHGEQSAPTIEALIELATLQGFDGRLAEAEQNFRAALAAEEATPAPAPRALARICNDLGTVLCSQGRLDEAEQSLLRALQLAPPEPAASRRAGLFRGPRHSEHVRADALNNLGLVRGRKGDHAGARALIEEALQLNRAALGDTHPYVATNLDNLAQALTQLGDPLAAEQRYREAIDIRRTRLDPDHPDLAVSLHNLGTLLAARADWENAERLVRDSFDIFRRSRGWASVETFSIMSSLVSCLGVQGRLKDAEALLLECHAANRDSALPTEQRYQLATRLAQLYDALRDPPQADRWRAEAARFAPSSTSASAPTSKPTGSD